MREEVSLMSFWSMMNWVVWGLCIVIVGLIATDFIKTEKEHSKKEEENAG